MLQMLSYQMIGEIFLYFVLGSVKLVNGVLFEHVPSICILYLFFFTLRRHSSGNMEAMLLDRLSAATHDILG